MNSKKFISIVTFLILFLLQSCYGQGNTDIKRDVYVQQILKRIITNLHIQPAQVNDTFSVKAFDAYLKTLDYNKRFFIKSDIDSLSYYKTLIDDQYNDGRFDFYTLSFDLITQRIQEAEGYYKEALTKPFKFDKEEFIQMNADSISWAKDKKELKKRWYQTLKYEVLVRTYSDMESQRKAMEQSDTIKEKSFSEIEEKARESVGKRYKNWFDVISQWDTNDIFSYYMNAILSDNDPHTEFFPPKEKEDFDIRFSGQLQGIGATLSQRDGFITVVDIVPGSPSWKQGELEVNDKIIKVAQADNEPVDVVDMRLDKAVQLIRGPKDTEVRLTVQKIDGTQKVISIIRDVVVIEETYAKSMTITDKETGSTYGYIYLPSFYANFNDPKGRRCSKDMRAEVEKLKAENVEGIIIDLRNNTGGSLFDCIDIAGLFIDNGPVVQVKSKTSANVYTDRDKGIVYDGPLVVMVNQSSASASEIFAAAMQDYKRAIILGTTTFGKGTVQRFEDLDPLVMGADDIKPLGSIKVTLQKFYRINGGSTQLLGVTPDIPVTSIYKYIDYGERELDNPLAWTEMQPANYQIWKDGECDWSQIIDKSLNRMERDSFFIKMDDNAKRLKKVRDNTIYPLKYKDYESFIKKNNEESERFKNLGKDTLNIEAVILSAEKSNIPDDTTAVERNKKWHKQVITDPVLFEAIKVCGDLQKMPCFIRKEE